MSPAHSRMIRRCVQDSFPANIFGLYKILRAILNKAKERGYITYKG